MLLPPPKSRPTDPLFSVIVPVFNEAEAIDAFLAAIQPEIARTGARFVFALAHAQ